MPSRTTKVSCAPCRRRAPQNRQVRKMKNPQNSPSFSQPEELIPVCDFSFLFCRRNSARPLPTRADGVPPRLMVQVLRLLRARTVSHPRRDATRTADAEADAEFRRFRCGVSNCAATHIRRHARGGCMWWGMDCGSRGRIPRTTAPWMVAAPIRPRASASGFPDTLLDF